MPNKAVVFSQFTQMLDIIGHCLRKAGVRFERLDGSMSRDKRENAINSLRRDKGILIFLMSLQTSNSSCNCYQ